MFKVVLDVKTQPSGMVLQSRLVLREGEHTETWCLLGTLTAPRQKGHCTTAQWLTLHAVDRNTVAYSAFVGSDRIIVAHAASCRQHHRDLLC